MAATRQIVLQEEDISFPEPEGESKALTLDKRFSTLPKRTPVKVAVKVADRDVVQTQSRVQRIQKAKKNRELVVLERRGEPAGVRRGGGRGRLLTRGGGASRPASAAYDYGYDDGYAYDDGYGQGYGAGAGAPGFARGGGVRRGRGGPVAVR